MLGDTATDLHNEDVTNPDGWYPNVNVQEWQERYRVPGTAPKTLAAQLALSMRRCNSQLAEWKAALIEETEEAGLEAPEALPDDLTDDYVEAVMARAFGLLIPLLPSSVTDEKAAEKLGTLQQTPADFFARSDGALRAIRGETARQGRMKAELI